MSCKESLRREMIKRRKAEGTIEASVKISEAVKMQSVYKNAKNVMLYMPILNEVDITGITDDEKCFLVPVTEGDTMYACPLKGGLIKGAFNVPEPESKEVFDKCRIELVIVPGVAFDKKMNRMGFGKGYYDRFLEKTDAFKIGVCYSFQMKEEIPSDEHDVKMDMIITEDGVWSRENTL